jgi:hypothetical protein
MAVSVEKNVDYLPRLPKKNPFSALASFARHLLGELNPYLSMENLACDAALIALLSRGVQARRLEAFHNRV